MKKYIAVTLLIIMGWVSLCEVRADNETLEMDRLNPKDTVEVQFGDKGKIIIQVDNPQDLEILKSYDINTMLRDLQLSVEESGDSSDVVIIEDASGEKYLNSEEGDAEFRELEEAFKGTGITVGSVAPTVKTEEQAHSASNKKDRFSGNRTSFVSFFDFGMNNYMEDGKFPDASNAQYTVRPWGSWYVAINPGWQTHVTGKFAIDYGGSVSWYNFKWQDPSTRLVKGEEMAIFDTWDPELKATKSKLTVTYINAHLVPVFDFGYGTKKKMYDDGTQIKKTHYKRNRFRIGLGGYVGYRIGSHTKLVSRANGGKEKSREKNNFYLSNVRYGGRFLLGFGEVDFFINYDINTLFAENRGPELNAFSFGINF